MNTRILVLLTIMNVVVRSEPGPIVSGASVTECGIYTAKVVYAVADTNVHSQARDVVEEFALERSTTNVPARIGVRFGFRYRIEGQPTGSPITLTMVGRHPAQTNAWTGAVSTRDEYPLESWIGETFTSYSFDEAWECCEGHWVFEVWYQGRKLCEQGFWANIEGRP